jgi:hypothetical protein
MNANGFQGFPDPSPDAGGSVPVPDPESGNGHSVGAGVVAILRSTMATGLGAEAAAKEVAPYVGKGDLVSALLKVDGIPSFRERFVVIDKVMPIRAICDSIDAARKSLVGISDAQYVDPSLMPAVSAQESAIAVIRQALIDTMDGAYTAFGICGMNPSCWLIGHILHPEVMTLVKEGAIRMDEWLPRSIIPDGSGGVARAFDLRGEDLRVVGGMVLDRLTITKCARLEEIAGPMEVTEVAITGCDSLRNLDIGAFVPWAGTDLTVKGCMRLERVYGTGRFRAMRFPDCRKLRELPPGLSVAGDLDLRGCVSLEGLPAGMAIGGNLIMSGCGAWEGILPEDASVSGKIYSDHAQVPMDIERYRLHMAGLDSPEDAHADQVGKALGALIKPSPWGIPTQQKAASPSRQGDDLRARGWIHGVD